MSIKIPENLKLTNAEGKEVSASFANFVVQNLLSNNYFGESYQKLLLADKLKQEVSALKPGEVWEIKPEDHSVLSNIIQTTQYQPLSALSFMPFFKAIVL